MFSDLILTGTPQMHDATALLQERTHISEVSVQRQNWQTSKPVKEEAEEAWGTQPWEDGLQEQLLETLGPSKTIPWRTEAPLH